MIAKNMKYGMFVHYVERLSCRRDGTKLPLGQAAEEFDVERFADDLESFGVEYVIFTAWHFDMVCLYPAPAVDAWLPGHSVKRDLVGEILAALKPRGIGVILYTHPRDGHDFSEADAVLTGWGAGGKPFAPDPNPETYDATRWNDFINDAYAELVDRYGRDILGLYLDEGNAAGNSDRLVDYPRLRNTIKSRAPHLVMIQNFYGNLYTCDLGDKEYCHWGEFASTDGDTWPAYAMPVGTVFSQSWMAEVAEGRCPVPFTPESLFRYTVLQAGANTDGFGVQWAAGPYAGGGWETGVAETMTALGRFVGAVGTALKNTVPSTSYVTSPGTRILDLDWGVATDSPDGRTTYLHVLKAPEGKRLVLPVPADGRSFEAARLHPSGKPVRLLQSAGAVELELAPDDAWNPLDTCLALDVRPEGEEPVR